MKIEKLEQLLFTAETWAEQMHDGQLYNGKDYIDYHIVPVVKTVEYLTKDNDALSRTDKYFVKIIAYLHDILEDTEVVLEDIHRTFGKRIAEAVLVLTKVDNEPYESTIARVLCDDLAIWVKKADNMVNLRESLKTNNKRLIRKYLDSLEQLNDV